MASLGEIVSVLRSKNAGPFQVTIDLMFATLQDYQRVLDAGVLTPASVAALYGTDAERVQVVPFERVRAIKITVPRRWGSRGSGSSGDRDVYGAQQHGPLVGLEVD